MPQDTIEGNPNSSVNSISFFCTAKICLRLGKPRYIGYIVYKSSGWTFFTYIFLEIAGLIYLRVLLVRNIIYSTVQYFTSDVDGIGYWLFSSPHPYSLCASPMHVSLSLCHMRVPCHMEVLTLRWHLSYWLPDTLFSSWRKNGWYHCKHSHDTVQQTPQRPLHTQVSKI